MPTLHPPSRGEKIGRALGYVFTALIGFGALWFPTVNLAPDGSIQNTSERLGPLVWLWATFMITALPAAVATLMGRHRVEYVLIPLFTMALLVANVNAWFNVTQVDPSIMARASASSALVCLLVVRWFGLGRLNKVQPWTQTEP